jgi:hypothetical protein
METVRTSVSRSKATTIYSRQLLTEGRQLVQDYFRQARPELSSIGATEDELAGLDQAAHDLLHAMNSGRVAKAVYSRRVKAVRMEALQIDAVHERRLGQRALPVHKPRSSIESQIAETLANLVPTAALSYEQALQDLAEARRRLSYRGTANELRECLRDVLDHLAPDDRVSTASGFRLERDRDRPTQRQKALHILRSRGSVSGQRQVTVGSVEMIEERVAAVTRSSSQRSSVASHVSSTHAEVMAIKGYLDAVLVDLLEIHH